MTVSGQAIAVLRAMRGNLWGCLEDDAPFAIDPGWSGIVPGEIAQELHDAGLIEIDEDAPIGIPFAFRISTAGRLFLARLVVVQRAESADAGHN